MNFINIIDTITNVNCVEWKNNNLSMVICYCWDVEKSNKMKISDFVVDVTGYTFAIIGYHCYVLVLLKIVIGYRFSVTGYKYVILDFQFC